MPFTFSHPAAVLPIHAKLKPWISLPALAVGSMVPDAAYYLPLPVDYKANAHTLLGVFTFGLPVGIALLLIFYWVAAEVVSLLPSPQREALQPLVAGKTERTTLGRSALQALLAVAAIVIGAETHILWDSFTHETGWIVLHVSLLQAPLWQDRLPVYFALQFLTSLAGLYIVLYFMDRWLKARGLRLWTPPEPSPRLYLWAAVLAVSFAEAFLESHTLHGLATMHLLHNRHLHFALLLVTDFIRNVLLALVALPIGAKLRRRWPSLRDTAY